MLGILDGKKYNDSGFSFVMSKIKRVLRDYISSFLFLSRDFRESSVGNWGEWLSIVSVKTIRELD